MSGIKFLPLLDRNKAASIIPDPAQDDRFRDYRRLAIQLHHELNARGSSRSVMIVSPDDAGTCAILAANLACCMAEELGREVLLADATREGRLSAALVDGIPHGLNTFLSNPETPFEELLLPTSFTDVTFLPCGTRRKGYTPDNSKALLLAASGFAFVVVAAGAILSDPFALASASAFGSVILLVVEHETPMKEFSEASYSLKMCGAEQVRVALVKQTSRR